MSNNNTNQNSGGGRKKGSQNKYSKKSKEHLLEVFKDSFKRLNKDIAYIPYDERFIRLKPYAKILCTGSDEVSEKCKELIFNSLKSEFTGNKLKSYLNQLTPEKRAIEMRQYLQMLNSDQIEKLFDEM